MSTEIKIIDCHLQVPKEKGGFEVDYINVGLHINRFFGGKEKGTMIQLTPINGADKFVLLTRDQVADLIEVLNNAFNYDKYPSE